MYTKKQMGDPGEMLVAAELTLHGVPSFIVPGNWPGYDVVAQPRAGELERISVKTRTFARSGNFAGFSNSDHFDWLAVVILLAVGCEQRRIFIAPRQVVLQRSYEAPKREGRGFFVHKLMTLPQSELPDVAMGPE